MATSNKRWIDSLQFSSLFRSPPQDAEQWNVCFLLVTIISVVFPHYIASLYSKEDVAF